MAHGFNGATLSDAQNTLQVLFSGTPRGSALPDKEIPLHDMAVGFHLSQDSAAELNSLRLDATVLEADADFAALQSKGDLDQTLSLTKLVRLHVRLRHPRNTSSQQWAQMLLQDIARQLNATLVHEPIPQVEDWIADDVAPEIRASLLSHVEKEAEVLLPAPYTEADVILRLGKTLPGLGHLLGSGHVYVGAKAREIFGANAQFFSIYGRYF